jgi:hypothetical protein
MSPDVIVYLLYAEILVFSFLFLNNLVISIYYYVTKIDNKQAVFSKIIVSIFKREKIWLDNIENNNLKNYCRKTRRLIKINFLFLAVFVLLFIAMLFVIALLKHELG